MNSSLPTNPSNPTVPPRVAILIVGEYRTFADCRKSMLFLDQSNINADVYFSTWDITNTLNPIPGTYAMPSPVYIPVTKTQIETDIGVSITCAIHSREEINEVPFILRGWLLGFKLIKNSSIKYDYVLVLRPDIFFENTEKFNSYLLPDQFEKYKNSIGIRHNNNETSDDLFFSTYDNLDRFFSNFMKYWELNGITHKRHWHPMLYCYITEYLNLTTIKPPITGNYVIARFPTTSHTTYKDAEQQWWKWFKENQ